MKSGGRWATFESASGGEVRKERPTIIVSNDAANKHLNRVQVVPLTTSVDRVYPSEALVTVRGKKHKAMADQLTTVAKGRLQNRVGRLSKIDLKAVEQAIRVQLGLTLLTESERVYGSQRKPDAKPPAFPAPQVGRILLDGPDSVDSLAGLSIAHGCLCVQEFREGIRPHDAPEREAAGRCLLNWHPSANPLNPFELLVQLLPAEHQ